MSSEDDSGYVRLETQIEWYDTKSVWNHQWYRSLKVVEIVFAAGVAVVATYFPIVAGVLGGMIVVLAGVQNLGRFHDNWTVYRSTCEALRHEKYLYLAGADAYDQLDAEGARKLLATRVESLISTEHAKWVSVRQRDEEG